ncbi:hypothetical protein BCR35DRAFT_288228 [Leucosporidium creatinivorum]|uniref:Uncharacterized protein n=1 Tax=Leucosporidium creatinivorum TaxID=106004 RepID=A0A1Y2G208_9BASI|nr:hypothetical protein BCR35DRAFT_288228 [Leucosporidium creatinivorum]
MDLPYFERIPALPTVLAPSPRHPLSAAASQTSTPTLATSDALPLEMQVFSVIGGGTGANAILGAFSQSLRTTHILPISDDGGSSSEIQRVLGGGPSVGDLRSRLVRLIPESSAESPLHAIKTLLEYRLSDSASSAEAKSEWHRIIEGKHRLWAGIPNDRKECIRAFLVHVNSRILKKAQRGFNFKRASIGNLFLAGAQLFLGSLPSAIFLFASVTEIPHETFRVVPVINTSSTATIAAELEDGTVIAGQSEISHPSPPSLYPPSRPITPALRPPTPSLGRLPPSPGGSMLGGTYISRSTTPALFEARTLGDEEDEQGLEGEDDDELEAERNRNVVFSKDAIPLESRISRIFYLNAYGNEIFPRANPQFIESLSSATTLIYSPGSLYTSIIPCLALRGVGEAIATSSTIRAKVLFLNSSLDRETPDYTALDFVEAIRSACSGTYGEEGRAHRWEARDLISHVVYIEEGEVQVDTSALESLGIASIPLSMPGRRFDEEGARKALRILDDGHFTQ